MFGTLFGMVTAKTIGERFGIAPFKDKMFVFADEVKFQSKQATEEIKLLIRSDYMSGEEKNQDVRDYNIYARMMFASNNMNTNIGQTDAVDRALFYTKAYSADFLKMKQLEFIQWTTTLKPMFGEFAELLRRPDVRAALMHMFVTRPVEMRKIEDITYASSMDADIVLANVGGPRRICKEMIEQGWVIPDNDISMPFTLGEFATSVTEYCAKTGNRHVIAKYVWEELQALGMLEHVNISGSIKWRFKWLIGTLTERFGEATGLPMQSQFEFKVGDWGENTNDGAKRTPARGGFTRPWGSKF
jgi:hypothetical protein